jgi:hypothetical protein
MEGAIVTNASILSFRPLAADDLPSLLEWLSKEHVKEWWDDGDNA